MAEAWHAPQLFDNYIVCQSFMGFYRRSTHPPAVPDRLSQKPGEGKFLPTQR